MAALITTKSQSDEFSQELASALSVNSSGNIHKLAQTTITTSTANSTGFLTPDHIIILISTGASVAICALVILLYCVCRSKRKKERQASKNQKSKSSTLRKSWRRLTFRKNSTQLWDMIPDTPPKSPYSDNERMIQMQRASVALPYPAVYSPKESHGVKTLAIYNKFAHLKRNSSSFNKSSIERSSQSNILTSDAKYLNHKEEGNLQPSASQTSLIAQTISPSSSSFIVPESHASPENEHEYSEVLAESTSETRLFDLSRQETTQSTKMRYAGDGRYSGQYEKEDPFELEIRDSRRSSMFGAYKAWANRNGPQENTHQMPAFPSIQKRHTKESIISFSGADSFKLKSQSQNHFHNNEENLVSDVESPTVTRLKFGSRKGPPPPLHLRPEGSNLAGFTKQKPGRLSEYKSPTMSLFLAYSPNRDSDASGSRYSMSSVR